MGLSIEQTSPSEFFKERIEQATADLKVSTSEDTACYLTQLLNAFVRPDAMFLQAGVEPEITLAEIYCEAAVSQDRRRLLLLKLTGDLALFASGFFPASLQRNLVGPEYYTRLGGHAYGALSVEHRLLHELYEELAVKFTILADILSEVSVHCSLADDSDLLRLYECWLETGSPRSADVLRRQGIVLLPTSDEVH
jgi:hypothetical protein